MNSMSAKTSAAWLVFLVLSPFVASHATAAFPGPRHGRGQCIALPFKLRPDMPVAPGRTANSAVLPVSRQIPARRQWNVGALEPHAAPSIDRAGGDRRTAGRRRTSRRRRVKILRM